MTQPGTPQPARLSVQRATTLAVVAAQLGVSRTTVSNAYNRPGQLSPELRERVLSAARQLGYPGPDPVARSLRTKQAGAVGLLFTEALSYAFGDPAAVLTLRGLAAACEGARTGLLLVPGICDVVDRDQPALAARAAVDGFVAYSLPRGDPQLQAVLDRPVPLVVIDAPVTMVEADWVGIDDLQAATDLGEHLAALGHRDVGVVATKLGEQPHTGLVPVRAQRESAFDVVRQRIAGLAAGLGVDQAQLPVVECPEHSVDAAQLACRQLLAATPGLTAV
ncbi:MAG: LacI family DNA-binding transcriptional regulator, partial [Mycobacteriales bacterium]